MSITWLDVLKLTVPFVTAVLLIWIKAWVENFLARKRRQDTLTRLIKDEIQMLPDAVDGLVKIGDASRRGKLRLVSFDVPSLVPKYASDLSELDPKRAYLYSGLVSFAEIVNKGLSRLSSLVLERAKVDAGEPSKRLDRAINGQAKITALDFVSFGKSAFKVLKEIPEKRRNADSQAMNDLERKVEGAENKLKEWPNMATEEGPPPASPAP